MRGGGARRVALLAGLAAIVSLGGCAESDDEFFVAALNSSYQQSPAGSAAFGSVGFTRQGDTIFYSISAHGISGITGAHIRGGGDGEWGAAHVVLFPGPAVREPAGRYIGNLLFHTDPTGRLDGYLIDGSFTESEIGGLTFEELLERMRSEDLHVALFIRPFGRADIRGTIRPLR